jgi:hypothetical protein
VCQLLVTVCVTLSLTLFALDDADPTGGFYLQTLALEGPWQSCGILDMVAASHVVEGVIFEEQGACKHINRPLLHSTKTCGLSALTLTLQSIENNRMSLHTPASSRISIHRLFVVLLTPEERERIKGEKSKRERTRHTTLKDRRRRPEGRRGKWESIKIPYRNMAYIPKSI